MTECPILAEETIETAADIEDCKILVAILGTRLFGKPGITCPGPPWTDPIGHAIGGQRIVVP
jgi:hypothetical protein